MSGSVGPKDTWATSEHESYVGGWSRLVARRVRRLARGPARRPVARRRLRHRSADRGGAHLLRAGTGRRRRPGALRDYAQAHVPDPRAEFRAGDAQTLPVDDGAFDVVVSDWSSTSSPTGRRPSPRCRRAVRPRRHRRRLRLGLPRRDAADEALLGGRGRPRPPAPSTLDEAARFEFCRPDPLRALFTDAGLDDADVRPIVVPTGLPGLRPLLGPVPWAGRGRRPPTPCRSPNPTARPCGTPVRARLAGRRRRLDHLTARAWAVRGIR